MKKLLRRHLQPFGREKIPFLFPEHHLSHAASAFYPSPFEEAAILTIDGVGEWATTTIGHGRSGQISISSELRFPHSVGLLYSAFTYYLGFRVNSGEYKLMGLAAYGDPASSQTAAFRQKIENELVDIREDGSLLLNMDYFDFATGLKMTNDPRWEQLFGMAPKKPESAIEQGHMNLALAIQQVTETIVVALARSAKQITGSKNLVMAGGVALNCVANSKIVEAGIFEQLWIQPAAGDAGGALGAAYAAYHIGYNQPRTPLPTLGPTTGPSDPPPSPDAMKGAFLGPSYSDKEIFRVLRLHEARYDHFEDFSQLTAFVSQKLAEGKVVGWFQDRMEFGPRALGNRSILGDPRDPGMQRKLNVKIKSREGFRPFAPSVLIEDSPRYFAPSQFGPSPYMLLVASLRDELRQPEPPGYSGLGLYDRLYHIRSDLPAITHVDYSARIQTVCPHTHPKFWRLINDFKQITGCGMLINTSFNVRGEPIVCSPLDAWRGFMRTGMDYLVMGNYVLDRSKQPSAGSDDTIKAEFAPD